MSEERLTYRFGPLERRSLLGPLRGGQAAVLALAALVAVIAVDAVPSSAGALAAVLALAVAVAVGTVPIAGQAADEWTPIAVSFLVALARRRLRFRSPAPGRGMRWRAGAGRRTLRPPAPAPPPPLRDVAIAEIAYRERPLGALAERGGRRLTAVLACRVPTFALLDPDAQERRLARWGAALASAAGSPVRRVQWLERTAPAQGDELAKWLHSAKDPAVPLRGAPIIESYLELIGSSARVSHDHELLVAVQVDASRGGGRYAAAPEETLIEQTERVAAGLEAAEVAVLGALSPGQVARVLRTAYDPYGRAELAALEAADRERDGLDPVNAWPLGAHETWDHYRAEGALHATYWIAAWPRVEVSPMFMDPLLGSSSVTRTVAVCFEPISPDRSAREIESAITRDRADSELRRRFGQSETARPRQGQAAAMRREEELAAGHCEVRLAGFVTVTGRDPHELRRACAAVLEQAARARLELHRLYGRQAEAFTFTLPLARGLR